MRAVVTGAAGFIGSQLCAHLLAEGDQVVGIDSLTDYYDPLLKERNLRALSRHPAFTQHRTDLLAADLGPLVLGADVIYHLAAQPGVRPSWGRSFAVYTQRNVLATQLLLEAVRQRPPAKFVYASSSSVYGDAERYPTPESVCPQPRTPYGVTKLAAEHLCELYRAGHGVPTVSLRLFSVYGPAQRPDMAFARLVAAALSGIPFPLYGDGEQIRDFTYVGDVVRAMRDVAATTFTGVANLGGDAPTTMKQAIAVVESLVGTVNLVRHPAGVGEARRTGADIGVAAREFGFRPRTELYDGLATMVDEHRRRWSQLGVASG